VLHDYSNQCNTEIALEDSPLLPTSRIKQSHGSNVRPIPWQELLTVFLAAFTPLARGFITGYTSPTVDGFLRDGLLTSKDAEWFGSIVNIGGMMSCFIGSFVMERLGRRGTLMAAACVQGTFTSLYNYYL